MYEYLGENVSIWVLSPSKPGEGDRLPSALVTGSWDLVSVGAGNWILVLEKICPCSCSQRYYLSFLIIFFLSALPKWVVFSAIHPNLLILFHTKIVFEFLKSKISFKLIEINGNLLFNPYLLSQTMNNRILKGSTQCQINQMDPSRVIFKELKHRFLELCSLLLCQPLFRPL